MGIRVHKVIGYGISDLKSEKYSPADERIDPDGMLGEDRWEDDRFTREAYLSHLTDRSKAFKEYLDRSKNGEKIEWPESQEAFDAHLELTSLERNKDWEPNYSVVYSPEYGLDNVLLIVPPSCYESWTRYDNPIDYIEETDSYRKTDQLHRFVTFDRGSFPGSSTWTLVQEILTRGEVPGD